jgi:uncharacterized membrane protein (UPF0127 family)
MKKGIVYIGEKNFHCLLAVSSSEQEKGLMHQKPPVPTMAFVYSKPRVNKFWMSNTPAPLDIVFCLNGKVVQICKGEPYSTRIIGSDLPSDLVLEFGAGTCEKYGITFGDDVFLKKL